jgi:4-hydroxy-tetrahydrodipicolinate synthase
MGVISVVSNLIPNEMSMLCRRWFDGDITECRRLHEKYLKLMKILFCEVNPIPLKTAMGMMGLCFPEMRLPLCEMGESNKKSLKALLEGYGFI